nr:MAG TPA: hypothetical protein [Caudoviricetes sp.]DAT55294.1 MAG TPA: hypothetical protein [Caudoviricetes sp.]DAU52687.1 MAG TPA: hypothetical protein [Caudoviricetes sp.]
MTYCNKPPLPLVYKICKLYKFIITYFIYEEEKL